jgi:hypothetical protein|tara:strand:- start:5605 stop:5793 length:189 start_codon:yes stop_codon:yes gene_type:complete
MTEPKIEEEKYNLAISQSHLEIIAQALGQVQYNASAPVLQNIQLQLNKIEDDKKKTKKTGKA